MNPLRSCPSYLLCKNSPSFRSSSFLQRNRHSLASPIKRIGGPSRQHHKSGERRSMATSDPKTPAALNAAPPHHEHPALSRVEESKRRAAYKAVEDHFDPSYRYIGIGSGSTVVYVVEAIAAKGRNVTSKMIFIPTGMPILLPWNVFRH